MKEFDVGCSYRVVHARTARIMARNADEAEAIMVGQVKQEVRAVGKGKAGRAALEAASLVVAID